MWGEIAAAVGGLIQNRRNIHEANQAEIRANAAARQAWYENIRFGTQYRVADAKDAGLHPLFALGGGTTSPAMTVMNTESSRQTGIADAGAAIGRAIDRRDESALAQKAAEAAARNAAAMERKDAAIASYYEAQAAKIRQDTNSIALPVEDTGVIQTFPVQSVAPPVRSSMVYEGTENRMSDPRPHIIGGSKPGFERYMFGRDFPVLIPKTSEPAEAFEDKPTWFWLAVIQANVDEYGIGWLAKARRAFPDSQTFREAWQLFTSDPQTTILGR